MFDKDRTTISRHLNSILKDENRTCAKMGPTSAKFAQVQLEGDRKIARNVDGFSLDVVLQIGERIKSNKGKELKTYIDNYFKQQFSNNDNNIIIYNNGSLSLPVNVSQEEETVWLNESQIAMLFETTRQNINLHINNILSDGELDAGSICKDFLHMGSTGQQYLVTFYNLDMVLAIGYRVKTKKALSQIGGFNLKPYIMLGQFL